MLLQIMIAKDQRFKAATSGAGISNLKWFWDDQYIRDYITELGTPWDGHGCLAVPHLFLKCREYNNPNIIYCRGKGL